MQPDPDYERILVVQQPSRKRVVAGDIFTMRLVSGGCVFGRVISTGAVHGGVPGLILIYVYSGIAETAQAPCQFDKNRLLFPPLVTNRQGWLKGYFQTVEHRPLVSEDRFPVHCFQRRSFHGAKSYFDEFDQPLPARLEPCGEYVVAGYSSIDRRIAKALSN